MRVTVTPALIAAFTARITSHCLNLQAPRVRFGSQKPLPVRGSEHADEAPVADSHNVRQKSLEYKIIEIDCSII